MSFIISDIGEQHLLKLIIGNIRPTKLILNLYSNDVNLDNKNFIAPDFIFGNQLSDGSFVDNGYSSVELDGSNWTISYENDGSTSAVYNTSLSFVFTNGLVNAIHGYFISVSTNPAFDYVEPYILPSSGTILWAEKFSNGPYTILNSGSSINITPKIKLGSARFLYPTPTPSLSMAFPSVTTGGPGPLPDFTPTPTPTEYSPTTGGPGPLP